MFPYREKDTYSENKIKITREKWNNSQKNYYFTDGKGLCVFINAYDSSRKRTVIADIESQGKIRKLTDFTGV